MKYKCLSIAGFDGSGGAGIQADLKTFSALGCYGMTILTALPVQNTCGIRKIYDIPLQAIADQLEAIFADITPDCVKIGMLFSEEVIELVSDFLRKNATSIPLVLDPVMIAKSGDLLLLPSAIDTMINKLIGLCTIITPNLPESYELVGYYDDQKQIATKLLQLGAKSVLLKGGHNKGWQSNDLFMDETGHIQLLEAKRINSKNTHGTGCTLSAAICAFIARGMPVIDACRYAKNYLTNAINHSKDYSPGKGHGSVHHFYHLWPILKSLEV